MNRREQMRLVDEGIAILEQLNSGAMSRKAEISAVDRMLEIVELIGGGSNSKYDGYIKIAADSIEQLRLIDVDRVLEESGLKGDELKAFGDYIIKNRPDLDGFVKDGIAEKLAALLGVKLKEVKTRFNDLPKEQQIDFVADFMTRTGVYNLYLDTKKDDDLSDADIAILGDINANYSDDTLREFERNAVKKILEKGVSLTANSRNTIPESDLRGLNITPVAKITKIKKTAKTPDDLFKLVATTAATNDVRLAITGIKVEANGDLITTDGHTMTVIRDSGIKREAGIYPTSKTVNDFKRELLKQGKTQEEIDEAIAEHEAALKKENFPDYHRVLPNKNRFMPNDFITVDLAKFKGIVDSIYRACTKAVSHKFGGIQLESEDTVATVNYVYLLNAIKTLTSMGYQDAVFWFSHEDTYMNRSMMLQSHDEKVSSIITPMRSNHKDTLAFKPINLNNLDDWNWQKDDFNSVDDETETEYYWLCQEELDLIAA